MILRIISYSDNSCIVDKGVRYQGVDKDNRIPDCSSLIKRTEMFVKRRYQTIYSRGL